MSYRINTSLFSTDVLTDNELFEIFPEGKQVILRKIKEYEEDREEIIRRLQNFQNVVKQVAIAEKQDNFFVWFWAEAYIKYFHADKVVNIDKHLYCLRRQKRTFDPVIHQSNSNYIDWEELKHRAKAVPIDTIVIPYLQKPRIYGQRIMALCPFHEEKTPSFVVYLNENQFHCYGCQKHGDTISFLMEIEKIDFKEAIRRLA